jgi:hypothetical protein
MGTVVAPYVTSAADQADRGPFLVSTFVPDAGGPGYHLNERYFIDPSPGWDGGFAPARRYEFKFYVKRSDPGSSSTIFGTDPNTPIGLFLVCNQPAGGCLVAPNRGMAAPALADILVPPMTWTKVVVEIPPITTTDGSAFAPTQFDVTVEVSGAAAIKKTTVFSGDLPTNPNQVTAIGLGRPNAYEGAWEVWFDDVAVSY